MTALQAFREWVTERLEAGETRTRIAQRIGIAPSLITKLMQGERTGVSGKTAFLIEAATRDWERGPIPAASWYAEAD